MDTTFLPPETQCARLIEWPAVAPATREEAQERARQYEAAALRCARESADQKGGLSLQLLALAGLNAQRARGLWLRSEVLS